MKNIKLPEILSPAGNMNSAYASINNGCDAIYLGGENFSARSSAENFKNNEIIEIINYSHLRGVKVYVAVNTLYKDFELNKLFDFLNKIYYAGADAFIVQDIGSAIFIKKNFPNIKLHGSTQMTVHSISGVNYLESLGFDRVVLSRELSLEEISYIKENSNIEIEVFIHGAICVSFSGQCLMSSVIGPRSGNRGSCAQNCRMEYSLLKEKEEITKGYLLSPKDISAIEDLDKLIETKIDSLKIEGRMKNSEYTSLVTKTYRQHLEKTLLNNYSVDQEEFKKLTQIFNRGGSFSKGYFNAYSGKNMMSTKTPKSTGIYLGKVTKFDTQNNLVEFITEEELNPGDGIEIWTNTKPHTGTNINKNYKKNETVSIILQGNIEVGNLIYRSYDKKLSDELKKLYSEDTRKLKIFGNIKAISNEKIKLELYKDNILIEIEGNIIEEAKNKPMNKERVLENLEKTGGTPFLIDFKIVDIDNNIFIPISELNKLRRDGLKLFEDKFLDSFKRTSINYILDSKKEKEIYKKEITALARKKEVFDILVEENIYLIYLDINCLEEENINYYLEKANNNKIKLFLSLPTVTRNFDLLNLKNKLDELEKTNISGFLIKNYEQLELLKNSEKEISFNYNFNVLNKLSYNFLKDKGNIISLSTELDLNEINNIGTDKSEIVIYGQLPVMTTVQCPVGLYAGEKNENRFCKEKNNTDNYFLKDRLDFEFPVKTNCDLCYGEIFNSSTILMAKKFNDMKKSKAKYLRLEFLDENLDAIKKITSIFVGLNNNKKYKENIFVENITYGHFYKGIL